MTKNYATMGPYGSTGIGKFFAAFARGGICWHPRRGVKLRKNTDGEQKMATLSQNRESRVPSVETMFGDEANYFEQRNYRAVYA